ncbi:hypothetical protein GGR66_001638 [Xanthomonas sp. 3498]|nr:hypothetical protein [Xanthomonas sp. 3498]
MRVVDEHTSNFASIWRNSQHECPALSYQVTVMATFATQSEQSLGNSSLAECRGC